MPKTILAVDDEDDILELLSYNLQRDGYKVVCSDSGEDALAKTKSMHVDLILLDLMLPGMNGRQVARALKDDPATMNIPIIMITAKGEDADIVAGLELGADDYITKPFSPRVLCARAKAVLRRRAKQLVESGHILRAHELVINSGKREVTAEGKTLPLTYTEFQILQYLAGHPGWVFTRNQIVDAVRGEGYAVTQRSVDVQIVGLRKKLGYYGQYIETVRGVGYRFTEKKKTG